MRSELRKLNGDGLRKFKEYLEALRDGDEQTYPANLLLDERFSEPSGLSVEVERVPFETRYDMGVYLAGVFEGCDTQLILGDAGVWSWLALFWFEQLCPRDREGKLKPGQIYNFILSERYNHRPRQAVRTTYMLVKDYGELARVFLCQKPHLRGAIIEEFAARQFYLNCRGVVEAANRLYMDRDRNSFKRGAAAKGAGSSRRFISFLQQIERTYDLFSISPETLIAMLPGEYSKFIPAE